jgi:hypothetical protein
MRMATTNIPVPGDVPGINDGTGDPTVLARRPLIA